MSSCLLQVISSWVCPGVAAGFTLCWACRVGVDNVVASDVRTSRRLLESGPFSYCDVLDKDNMARIILENGVTHVIHLATLLSGVHGGSTVQLGSCRGQAVVIVIQTWYSSMVRINFDVCMCSGGGGGRRRQV